MVSNWIHSKSYAWRLSTAFNSLRLGSRNVVSGGLSDDGLLEVMSRLGLSSVANAILGHHPYYLAFNTLSSTTLGVFVFTNRNT
jgi:hypothetical protein